MGLLVLLPSSGPCDPVPLAFADFFTRILFFCLFFGAFFSRPFEM